MQKFSLAFAATLALITTPLAAAEPAASEAAIKIAEDYLAAYSTFKVENMAPFMADDMVFTDPTSTNQGADGGSFIYEGKAAVMKGLGDYAAQYKDFYLNYDLERRYESNGVVVFVAQLTYTVISPSDQTFTGTAPIVTAITVKDGKVVRHEDLYDYAGNVKEFE
ncbi:nuclear transport factor 2 family protein [Hyphococcus sp.]|uniref:nuclear transport factor 2 family protein n=1 Tax=Hyphococcus sp. TaxID=2038636 RepID=UPI00208C590F|nr:MAG: hypothetical protein DHS20C04_31760 [Marinicaulis sp.]